MKTFDNCVVDYLAISKHPLSEDVYDNLNKDLINIENTGKGEIAVKAASFVLTGFLLLAAARTAFASIPRVASSTLPAIAISQSSRARFGSSFFGKKFFTSAPVGIQASMIKNWNMLVREAGLAQNKYRTTLAALTALPRLRPIESAVLMPMLLKDLYDMGLQRSLDKATASFQRHPEYSRARRALDGFVAISSLEDDIKNKPTWVVAENNIIVRNEENLVLKDIVGNYFTPTHITKSFLFDESFKGSQPIYVSQDEYILFMFLSSQTFDKRVMFLHQQCIDGFMLSVPNYTFVPQSVASLRKLMHTEDNAFAPVIDACLFYFKMVGLIKNAVKFLGALKSDNSKIDFTDTVVQLIKNADLSMLSPSELTANSAQSTSVVLPTEVTTKVTLKEREEALKDFLKAAPKDEPTKTSEQRKQSPKLENKEDGKTRLDRFVDSYDFIY